MMMEENLKLPKTLDINIFLLYTICFVPEVGRGIYFYLLNKGVRNEVKSITRSCSS